MTAVDEDRSLARPRNLAQDDEFILAFDFLLREQSTQLRIALIKRKHRLDAQGIRTAANGIARDALPENCPECINQDGFARTGLPREDVESRAKLNGNFLEQRKIPHAKALQHSVSSPQRISS